MSPGAGRRGGGCHVEMGNVAHFYVTGVHEARQCLSPLVLSAGGRSHGVVGQASPDFGRGGERGGT